MPRQVICDPFPNLVRVGQNTGDGCPSINIDVDMAEQLLLRLPAAITVAKVKGREAKEEELRMAREQVAKMERELGDCPAPAKTMTVSGVVMPVRPADTHEPVKPAAPVMPAAAQQTPVPAAPGHGDDGRKGKRR